MLDRFIKSTVIFLSVAVCLYTLWEVNYIKLQPLSSRAVFIMLGLVLCYLQFPLHAKLKGNRLFRYLDLGLAAGVVICCGYVIVQEEAFFKFLWLGDFPLSKRTGNETTLDLVIGAAGLVLVLEATRRSIGFVVPMLALAFIAHAFYCHGIQEFGWSDLPDWTLPHQGHDAQQLISATFYDQSQGVFGLAAGVMFKYVFLFVVFGAFLEMTGATQYIIDFAQKVFGKSRGGPAMVSVLGSGLMGSLSGSAVANAVTTGSFTIPMMRRTGFPAHVAGGITAAAASGGALVPPVMGAGAYMMLDMIKPNPTFLDVVKAALIPAILYYFSLLAIVYFYSRRVGVAIRQGDDVPARSLIRFEGLAFFGALGTLIGLLLIGSSPSKAVTGSLALILVLAAFRPQLKVDWPARLVAVVVFLGATIGREIYLYVRASSFGEKNIYWRLLFESEENAVSLETIAQSMVDSAILGMFAMLIVGLIHPKWRQEFLAAFSKSAKNGIALIVASACVGIIIGIVNRTPMADSFSLVISELVEENLLLALIGIMGCSLLLGMGVPSVVCYVLIASLMSKLLLDLNVPPLAAHLFIFYFGMMSMVTPPVALAGYASASIAEAPIMKTSFAAFRFALVGFTLPYMFVMRPALCLLPPVGQSELNPWNVVLATGAAVVGIVALAAGLTGCFRRRLSLFPRLLMFASAAALLWPRVKLADGTDISLRVDLGAAALFLVVAFVNCLWAGRESASEHQKKLTPS